MKETEKLKTLVKEKYGMIAVQTLESEIPCGCCSDKEVYCIMSEDYNSVDGYQKVADLGLGCGIPTEFAQIHQGDVVLDLGSGAGNDAFVVAKIVGKNGRVYGLDFTEEMIERANENKSKLNIDNVSFILGDIEKIPLDSNSVDVVISNCVLNLVPDKQAAFKETYRVLKQGGHFCLSDIVTEGDLTPEIKQVAEFYAGCISGAVKYDDYLNIIAKSGFTEIIVHKKKKIDVPDSILLKFVTKDNAEKLKKSISGIFSITVSGKKSERT